MLPASYDFNDRYYGDTSDEVQFTVTKTVSNVTSALDLSGVSIRMHFKKEGTNRVVKSLDTTSGITFVDASNGVFKINSFLMELPPHNYDYDIEFTFSSGVVRTYLRGNFNVVNDITK